MLRGVEARRDVNERNRSILEATEALDMEIKRVQYGIQTVFHWYEF
jgi:hypothetical protein